VEITTIIQVADWSIPFMRVAVVMETQITFRFAGLDMAGSCSSWVFFSLVFRGMLEHLFSVALLTTTENVLD
jgi:hypothetical protein